MGCFVSKEQSVISRKHKVGFKVLRRCRGKKPERKPVLDLCQPSLSVETQEEATVVCSIPDTALPLNDPEKNPPLLQCSAALSNNPEHDKHRYQTNITDTNITHFLPSGVVESWDVGEMLGRGGYGDVKLHSRRCLATDKMYYRAVKSISGAAKPDKRKLITREIDALIELRRYPDHFTEFYGWFQDDTSSTIFLAMEYFTAGDLHQYITKDPPCAKLECAKIVMQILQALEIMHELNLCHRDLKPQNVLVASVSPLKLKLADFGLSKYTIPNHGISHADSLVIGTFVYMPPEMRGGGKGNAVQHIKGVDIWAVGVIAHEIFTGYPAFCKPISGQDQSCGASPVPSGVEGYSPGEVLGRGGDPAAEHIPGYRYDEYVFWEYRHGQTVFPTELLQRSDAPEALINFIQSLLVVDPMKRRSATDALKHSWFSAVRE